MDRFVALLWNPARSEAQCAAETIAAARLGGRWTTIHDAPGLRVLSRTPAAGVAKYATWEDEAGVVVGALFENGREALGPIRRIADTECRKISETGGAQLIERYWGNYVAFWRRPNGDICVLRDPCGAVPCFMTRAGAVDVLCSHVDDIADLPDIHLSIDWTHLRAFIYFNYFVTEHTGLSQLKELLAGERLTWTGAGCRDRAWLWSGVAFAASPHDLGFEETSGRFRVAMEGCISAWAKTYPKPLVSLSGGLDSSILVSLLRTASASPIGLHHVGRGYERYEVELAREAAAFAGIDLIEADQDPTKENLERLLTAPRTARPKMQSLGLSIDDVASSIADLHGADSFMLGQGGDNLFLQSGGPNKYLADYIRLRGLGVNAARVAYEQSTLALKSIWTTIGRDAQAAASMNRWYPYAFLDSDVWADDRPIFGSVRETVPEAYRVHPWLRPPSGLPPGKADHLTAIVGLYRYYIDDGRSLERDVVYPFFSQPVVELALQTPTYLMCHGGIDRAVERHAFSNVIPKRILQRSGKGAAAMHMLEVLQANLGFYRTLILDGEITRRGWLDRAKVERMLTPEYLAQGGVAIFVNMIAVAEAWAHSWRENSTQVIARTA